ncbi:MAG: hypothetical protein HKN57_00240 [Xanthomonadales bacterium]|nr:hypothetical protein [Gammaproteobacteria bacterium]MBT8052883.1 hypothetical protein [Gammaproteobacteria bacterium]NND55656.1 hypothetical protein [Xanthomonadales bacterium]NNK49967.1 hypothetical protein [Xanthomonadales bacterium]
MPGVLKGIVIALIFLVMLMIGAGWLHPPDSKVSEPLSPPALKTATESPASEGAGGFEPPGKSIAVMPFIELNAGPVRTPFFISGIHAEVAARLAQNPALKITAVPSVETLAGTDWDVRITGERLGVAHLIEGTVRQSKDRIRIRLQLIDAQTTEALWAETYDRVLSVDSLFEIQAEIAGTIADIFRTEQTSRHTRNGVGPTTNLSAYRAVLASRQLQRRGGLTALTSAVEKARQATFLDPEYTDAGIALASALTSGIDSGLFRIEDEATGILEILDSALSQDPENARAWSARAHYQSITGDARALGSYRRSLEINPGDAETLTDYAIALQSAGRPGEALPHLFRAVELDPLSLKPQLALGTTYDALDQHEKARETFGRIREMQPSHPAGYREAGLSFLAQGRLDEALFWMNQARVLDPKSVEIAGWILFLNDCLEDYAAADKWSAWLAGKVTNQPQPLAMQARHFYLTGDFELALQHSNLALRLGLPDRLSSDAVFMRIKRDEALANGDPESGIRVFADHHPDLFRDQPDIGADNMNQATDLALLLNLAGRRDEAMVILRAVITAHEKPYFTGGFAGAQLKTARAEALALLGDQAGALAELRRVVNQGWRASWRWRTDLNPNFDTIRNRDEFRLLLLELEADTMLQRSHVQGMAETGEIAPPPSVES